MVFYSDYQSKVATLEADLYERQLRCRHNYTVNMYAVCDLGVRTRPIRAQREFCLAQRFCM